jgi:hypothetical protein
MTTAPPSFPGYPGGQPSGPAQPPAFGSAQPPAFGSAQPPAFGSAQPPAFGSAQPPAFGSVPPPVGEQVSEPPQGPGVHPPFPAPPVEGRGRRIGLGLGIGAGVLLLVCGGGLAAVIGLSQAMKGAFDEQAHVVVAQYLDALHDRKFDRAYGLLCEDARDDESPAEYRSRVSAMEPIETYQLGHLDLVSFSVPVDATYEDGHSAQLDAHLGQNRDTGAFEVCDVGE